MGEHMTKRGRVRVLILGIFLAVILIAGICWLEMNLGTGASSDYQGAVFAGEWMDRMPWMQLLSI